MCRVDTLIVDKTGTLTEGRPRFERTVAAPGWGEAEVLRLAARGQTNKQIGVALHISDRTVQNHLANIYAKLGVASRTEAVTQGLQRNLISLSE